MKPEVLWIECADQLASQRLLWEKLIAGVGGEVSPFHRFAWIHACWKCPANKMVAAICRNAEGVPAAGYVFSAGRDSGKAVLVPVRLLGLTPHISNAFPDGPVVVAVPGWSHQSCFGPILAEAMRRLRCPAAFFNGLGDSHRWLDEAVTEFCRQEGWRWRDGDSSTDAWLRIAQGREVYLAGRSAKFRSNQKRARRDLQQLGTHALIEAGEAGWPWAQTASAIVDCFSKCWQATSRESPLHQDHRRWTLEACGELQEAGLLRSFFYLLNEQPIAFEFGVAAGGIYYPLVRGIDTAHTKASPGNLLAEESIDFLHRRGIHSIYLGPIHLSATTEYKSHWLNQEMSVRNLLILKRGSWYDRLDAAYHRSALFRKLWWKLRLGSLFRR